MRWISIFVLAACLVGCGHSEPEESLSTGAQVPASAPTIAHYESYSGSFEQVIDAGRKVIAAEEMTVTREKTAGGSRWIDASGTVNSDVQWKKVRMTFSPPRAGLVQVHVMMSRTDPPMDSEQTALIDDMFDRLNQSLR